jgi:hypothetical protein
MGAEPLNVRVAKLTKNKREAVIVALSEFRGVKLIDVRVFASTEEGDKPTPKGLSLDIRRLPDLRAAIERAEDEARKLGLIKPEDGP